MVLLTEEFHGSAHVQDMARAKSVMFAFFLNVRSSTIRDYMCNVCTQDEWHSICTEDIHTENDGRK